MARVNYTYDPDDVDRWHEAKEWKGQTFKEWIRRALNQVADEQLAERDEARRKGRGR